jgi:hypothetical protein
MTMMRSGRRVAAAACALAVAGATAAGGYFWWYAAEDALHPGALLGKDLRAAFRSEAAVLG